jgi:hypothetical protein
MRTSTVLVLVLFAALADARSANAQAFHGFAGGGFVSDLNGRYPAIGGGVVVDLGQPWVSAGGQGDAFFSWPYAAGRGAVFVQVSPIPRRLLRPFALVGLGMGESAGRMFGGGLELQPRDSRLGLRVSVEDYLAQVAGFDCALMGYTQSHCDTNLHGGRAYTGHQVSLRVGVTFH